MFSLKKFSDKKQHSIGKKSINFYLSFILTLQFINIAVILRNSKIYFKNYNL